MTNSFKKPKAIIICGPTASGKSALALSLAQEINGAVINADSMQVYQALPIMTASPTELDKAKCPHYLYNFLTPTLQYSVANFIADLKEVLEVCLTQNLVPIITGGTGLYINAIMEGVSDIPDIDPKLRDRIRTEAEQEGIETLYAKLKIIDPEMAEQLKPKDKQRIIRAYEVIKYTGQSILEFRKATSKAVLADFEVSTYYLKPERELLYNICNERFVNLVENGGIEEARNFYASYPQLTTGPGKTLGVREISAYIEGKISYEKAISEGQLNTRRYAKRQLTWFNNQLSWDHEIISFACISEYQKIKLQF